MNAEHYHIGRAVINPLCPGCHTHRPGERSAAPCPACPPGMGGNEKAPNLGKELRSVALQIDAFLQQVDDGETPDYKILRDQRDYLRRKAEEIEP